MKRLGVGALLLVAAGVWQRPARACGWDNESYTAEAQSLPCVFDAVMGSYPKHGRGFYLARVAAADALLTWSPTHLDALDMKGIALLKLGRHKDAEAVMRRRAELTPDAYAAHANLGTLYTFTGHWQDALAHIDLAMRIEPRAHFGREKFHRLLVEYLRDLAADPTLAQRDEFLRLHLTLDQRMSGSAQAFEKARVDPATFDALVAMIAVYGADKVSHVYLALGEALALHGNKRLAWSAYERAIELGHPRKNELRTWQKVLNTSLRLEHDKDPKAWHASFPAFEGLPAPTLGDQEYGDYGGMPASYAVFMDNQDAGAYRYKRKALDYTRWEEAEVQLGLPVWRQAGLDKLYAKANELRPRCQSPGVILSLPLPSTPAPAPAASVPSVAPPPGAERYVALLEKIAAGFSEHAGKCEALARSIPALTAQVQDLQTTAGSVVQSVDADPKLEPRWTAASNTIADGSMACRKNSAFVTAQKRVARPLKSAAPGASK